MWPFKARAPHKSQAPILLTNTLSRKKERFSPIKAGVVSLYSCGPTVYGPAQVGNLRSFVFSDVVARILTEAGYRVKRVMNITDVGHLTGDGGVSGDEGEDKIASGAAKEKTTPEEIARRYESLFKEDLMALNFNLSAIEFPRATDYIAEDVHMIETLEKKKLAYQLPEGVYFDTAKFPEYGKLGGLAEVKLMGGARVKTEGKKNLHDFALWRTAKRNDLQKWNSPWGWGNPGWSIECSAMATTLLGPTIDIHTGGEDLASVHHNNEIAQSEGVSGRPFVRYWLHGAFLTINGERLSKSLGNSFTLADIRKLTLHPLALRYFFMQAHYRTPLNFSWEALIAADSALMRLTRLAVAVRTESKEKTANSEARQKLIAHLRDDLGTPQALALLWNTLKDEDLSPAKKWGVISAADAVLGLGLTSAKVDHSPVPSDVIALMDEREAARKNKDFAKADELRIHIKERGYAVEDSPSGAVLRKSDE